MIFKNKKAYIVNKDTYYKTNTKSYDLLNNDFVYEVTFSLSKGKIQNDEMCVLARQGYNMGIYLYRFDSEFFIKWVWWENDGNGGYKYRDIFCHDAVEIGKIYVVKLIKKDNTFTFTINDTFEQTTVIETDLYNYSDKYIFVGAANPYCVNKAEGWFEGKIYDVKIYHSSDEVLDDLYLWFDFEKMSNFKVFDKSGNGNHGEIYESEKIKNKKSTEFNKLARPAKIV